MPEGYRGELFGPVYQAGEDGQLRMIDGTEADLTKPIYWVPAEVDHDQGDEPAGLGPEWVDLGCISTV